MAEALQHMYANLSLTERENEEILLDASKVEE